MKSSVRHTSLLALFCYLLLTIQFATSQTGKEERNQFRIVKKDQQTGQIRVVPHSETRPSSSTPKGRFDQQRLEKGIAFQKHLAGQIEEQQKQFDAHELLKKKNAQIQLLQAPKLKKIQAFGRETEFYQGPSLPVNRRSVFTTHAAVSNVSINGKQSDTISAGDPFTLSFSLTPNTISAVVNIYVDMNKNGIIDSADVPIILNGIVFDNGEYDKNSAEGECTFEFKKGNFYSVFIASLLFEVNDFHSTSTALLSIKDKMSSRVIIGKVLPQFKNAYMFFGAYQSNNYWFRYVFPDTSGQYIVYHDTTTSTNVSVYAGIAGNTPEGYLPLMDTSLTIKKDTTRFLRIHMTATEFIEGYVKDQNGDPVANAIVRGWLDCYNCNDIQVRTTTNSLGYYKVSVVTGSWRIEVDPVSIDGDYMSNNAQYKYVNVTSNQTTQADFTLLKTNSSISGSVKYGTIGIGGVPVVAYRDSLYHYAFTSGTGNYNLAVYKPAAGSYTYTAYTNTDDYGYAVDSVYRFDVAPGATNVNFTVKKVTGGLQGKITDINTGQPIKNASLSISSSETYRYARSNDTGYYKVLLPPGTYSINVNAQYYEYYYENNVIVSSTMITKNIALTRTGSFSGTVTDELGAPIYSATISARDSLGYYYYGSSSDLQGNYVVSGLPTANYKAQAGAQGFIPQWYNKKSTVDSATSFKVTKGFDTPNINFVLSRGGSISGVVKDKNGNGIPDVYVYAVDTLFNYVVSVGLTNDTGAYIVSGLTTGSFYAVALNDEYLEQWYQGTTNYLQAKKVPVVINQNTPNINFILTKGAKIRGTVTDKSGTPLQYADVIVYDSNFYSIRYGYTDNAGTYEIKRLKHGEKFFVTAQKYEYSQRWYNNAASQNLATPLVLTAEEVRENINFALPLAGKISGTVKNKSDVPIVSAGIYASQTDGYNYYYGYSDNLGNYTISNVSSGKYIVSASSYDYLQQWYNQKSSWELADTIIVEDEKTTSNINFVLIQGGKITGTVKTTSGEPITNVSLYAYSVHGGNYYYGYTDYLGNYSINNMNPGKYWVNAYSYDYGSQWYNHKTSIETADTVLVESEKTVSNINFDFKPLSGDSVVVKIVLDDLPDMLKFSQSHVSDYAVDYWWGVRFDVNADNDFETEIALVHFKYPGEQEFTADPVSTGEHVVIQWVGNYGYHVRSNVRVWRNSSEKNTLYLAVPKSWSEIQGMSSSSKFYGNTIYYGASGQVGDMTSTGTGETTVNDAKGDVPYAVADIISAGWKTQIMSVEKSDALPLTFSLEQNYPNPFNPVTTIRYAIPSHSNVKLVVFNLLGQEVATLVNEEQTAGWKEVQWNTRQKDGGQAASVASGIYFYKLNAGNFVETKKMLLVR
jgi:hypothetical protein